MSLEMTEPTLITQDTLIDSILDPYRALGPSLYEGYRSHAYRMLNFGRALALSDPKRDERLTVMAAFHDLRWKPRLYLIASSKLYRKFFDSHRPAAHCPAARTLPRRTVPLVECAYTHWQVAHK